MGYSALHWAVKRNDFRMIMVLISAGANPNCRDINNRTPIYYGVQLRSPDIVRLLLRSGARPKDFYYNYSKYASGFESKKIMIQANFVNQ